MEGRMDGMDGWMDGWLCGGEAIAGGRPSVPITIYTCTPARLADRSQPKSTPTQLFI